MNILCISKDGSIADLAYRLQQEGHNVCLYIDCKKDRNVYKGMLRQVKNWQKQLSWVGKSGLIIFDSTGYGKTQEDLRKEGYSVVGGSIGGDRCEDNRTHGQEVFWSYGMKMIPSKDFSSLDKAVEFVLKNPKYWVIKQNGHASKTFNYVGQNPDGSDVINVLESYRKTLPKRELKSIQLQERIFGVEIGIARYFNGKDWVGPVEMNLEHKNLCNGDLGPKTFEMGTVMWMDYKPETNKLYTETLAKLKKYLQKIDFRGDIDINCIVNESGIYPLEITARFGFPALHLQQILCPGDWGTFLKAIADGEGYEFKSHPERKYGVVTLLAVPPFPYGENIQSLKNLNLEIVFDTDLEEAQLRNIHFEEVSRRKNGRYYISGPTGFVLHVTAAGKSLEEAQERMYTTLGKIHVPKAFYRTDIGDKFLKTEKALLKKWGYL